MGYDTNNASKLKDNKTRCVDYGKDIADLAQIVSALQQQVAMLQRALEMNGTLYGGAVAYSTTYANGPTPDFTGFKTQFKY